MRYLLIFGILSFWMLNIDVFAQEEVIEDTLKGHSPSRAAKLSLMLPGAGQIYNHNAMPKGKKNAWWKVPIIYAGIGATGYLMVDNHIKQRALKTEFSHRLDYGEPSNPNYTAYDDNGVLQLYESHKGARDMMLFGFLAVYGLNILDALVEAHFVEFDVSPDLSMRFTPTMPAHQSAGLTVSLNFR